MHRKHRKQKVVKQILTCEKWAETSWNILENDHTKGKNLSAG